MTTLTFDLGQTGFRARASIDGTAGPEFSGPGYVMGTPFRDAINAVVREAVDNTGIERFDSIAGGVTGVFGRVPDTLDTARDLYNAFGTTRLTLADDAVTSYLGAVGSGPGIVVSLGTGLVALARSESGEFARVDGVGPLIGDEGSGWWIGRQGLIAALSAEDGREPASSYLLEKAKDKYTGTSAIPIAVASAASPIGEVAAFARVVINAARDADPTSVSILKEASGHIGRAVAAAARRAGLTADLKYSLIGGLSPASDLFLPGIARALNEWGPSSHLQPEGTSLDGAARLLREADDLPHSSLIRVVDLRKGDRQ
ncbi:N-acetylglucosamine kinase [Arthrobacter castelli]|uniref:N-acetylglucosamine kinase n=1 Tax=Arthrobacter castelli TaxID=271431 RepID=UPI00138AC046|nr:BadF/BadG/BcrA/BcrD ATPase family protein [Arthrobacter castelli]